MTSLATSQSELNRHRLVEIDRSECLRRLEAESFGRVAVCTLNGTPIIRPVNYRFDERSQSVIIRTAGGSKLGALIAARGAAFEIDGRDPDGFAWSVIISGNTELVNGAAEVARLMADGPRPVAPSPGDRLIRIRAFTVSGRRIAPAEPGTGGPQDDAV